MEHGKKYKKPLINEKILSKYPEQLIEQYKLYVETADKVSQRRDSANHFYLTLNSVLLPVLGYMSFLKQEALLLILMAIIGITISLYWLRTIDSYKNLNSGKFQVIHELEKHLPAELFRYEWDCIGKGKTDKYKPLTHVEKGVPKIFMVFYFLLILVTLYSLIPPGVLTI